MSPPPPPPCGAGFFSGLSAMTTSVVRNRAAIDAAFCSAERVTLAGSMMPALIRSTYSPVAALRPQPDFEVAHLLDHDAAFEAGVDRDLLERCLERDLDDASASGLVTFEVELLERGATGLQQRDATTGDDALFDSSLRVANGVFDAVLALLELDLSGRAGLDDGNAAGQLGQPLLQLLAVVVGVALLDLGADLVDATSDLVGVASTLDDGRLVLGDDDLAGPAEQVEAGGLELETDFLADDLAAGEDRDVAEHRLATVTEAGRLDGDRTERAADLVDDQRGKSLALDVFGDDRERLAALHDLLQQRQEVLDRARSCC